MAKKKFRKVDINILKLLNMSQDDADRIVGGIVRLENRYKLNNRLLSKCISLARNDAERCFVWYNIGLKIGTLGASGIIIPNSLFEKFKDDFEKDIKKVDGPEFA